MRTNHIQMTRGSSFVFTLIARDEKKRPRDLTDAKVYLAMRADVKVAPTVKLTSEDPAPATWRQAIVIEDQNEQPGAYTITFEPDDTIGLVALGHDDPWLYDVKIVLADDNVVTDVAMSNIDLYPQITDLPV